MVYPLKCISLISASLRQAFVLLTCFKVSNNLLKNLQFEMCILFQHYLNYHHPLQILLLNGAVTDEDVVLVFWIFSLIAVLFPANVLIESLFIETETVCDDNCEILVINCSIYLAYYKGLGQEYPEILCTHVNYTLKKYYTTPLNFINNNSILPFVTVDVVTAVLVVEEMLGVNNILEFKDIREEGEPFIVVAELFPLCNNVDNVPLTSPLVDLLCPIT
ncbi:hypothetical protein V1477_018789 [Vespula maculifrons]|uniref:Uncharacterized protein n=1 Tax=Vespula maculifrons TaxID=7453 RepID=A0ABD2AWF1_VESMC